MKKTHFLSAVLALGVSVAMLVQSATAATNNTWNNGTTDWNLGTNWSSGTKAGSGDIAIFSSVSGNQTINLNGNQAVSGLSFTHVGNTTLASGTPTTSTLNIGADGIAVSAGGAVNPGINVNVALSANQTWTVDGVNLLAVGSGGKTITNNGFNISIAGNSTVAVTGALTGTGGVVKNGINVLAFYGANTFSGGVTLNSGKLRMDSATALGTGTLTIAGGTIGTVATTAVTASNAVSVTGNFSYSSGNATVKAVLTLAGPVNLNGATRTITQGETITGFPGHIINGVISNGGIVKEGAGALTLGGVNDYTGNTTVNVGTLILADNSQSAFAIGANGVNNQFNGTGNLTLDGDFFFDLTNAGTTLGDSWTIVSGTLLETFGSTFSVVGFSDAGGNIWEITNVNGGRTYQFSEGTGILSVTAVPEPATWALLAASLSVTLILRRRKAA